MSIKPLVSNPYSYAKMVQSNHNLNTRWGVMQSSRYFADAKSNQPFNTDSLHYPIKETFYVKEIGMVAENYQSCGMAHKKLIRYKVDNRFNP